jgi:GNAT superfamily N-acetyltransferase
VRGTIRQADTFTSDDERRLFLWGADVFDTSHLRLQWRAKDVHFFWEVDERSASHVGVLKHVVRVGGQPITVGGLGGVVTRPEAQRQGVARLLMQHAAEYMGRCWGVEAGLLFCLPRMIAYYERLGWQVVTDDVLIKQPAGKVTSPVPVMVLPFGGRVWPAGEVDLDSLPW